MAKVESNPKRKAQGEQDDSDSTPINETIDVTFEFLDLEPIDYHALKHLISQLFRSASPVASSQEAHLALPPSKAALMPVPQDINVGELIDILLGPQKEWVGASVKCDDGDCSDPYAFASVLDLRAHQSMKSVSTLIAFFGSCLRETGSPKAIDLLDIVTQSLEPTGRGVGLLLSERLINMPVQVVPQLLMQVGNEIKHAQAQNAPGFAFDLVLIPSRIFHPAKETGDQGELNPSLSNPRLPNSTAKKIKKKHHTAVQATDLDNELDGLYHPEDHIIAQFATHTVDFTLAGTSKNHSKGQDHQGTGDLRGVEQRGRLMLMELSKWDQMIQTLMTFIGSTSS